MTRPYLCCILEMKVIPDDKTRTLIGKMREAATCLASSKFTSDENVIRGFCTVALFNSNGCNTRTEHTDGGGAQRVKSLRIFSVRGSEEIESVATCIAVLKARLEVEIKKGRGRDKARMRSYKQELRVRITSVTACGPDLISFLATVKDGERVDILEKQFRANISPSTCPVVREVADKTVASSVLKGYSMIPLVSTMTGPPHDETGLRHCLSTSLTLPTIESPSTSLGLPSDVVTRTMRTCLEVIKLVLFLDLRWGYQRYSCTTTWFNRSNERI